jgi:molecular chaperone GrpE
MTEHDKKKHAPEEGAPADVDFEPEEELGDVASARAKLKKVKDELEKVKKERQEYLDGWQRCKADAVNSRREALASGERAGHRAKEGLIKDILPALDSFDMAAGSPAWENVDTEWRKGMEQVQNQLLDVLSRHGVTRFGKVGERFDHALHEVVQELDDVAGEPGTIVRIARYGYRSGENVIRPAHVFVKAHA